MTKKGLYLLDLDPNDQYLKVGICSMPSMCRIDTHLRQFPNLSLKDSLIFTGTSRTINALENILKLHTTPPHQLPELFAKSDGRTEIIHKSKKEQISEILGMASNNLGLDIYRINRSHFYHY